MLDCETTVELFTMQWVYKVCCHAQLWCKCNGFSLLNCSWANRGIYVSYGRYCVPNPVGHTHMLCCGFLRTKFIGLCFLCVGALLSLICLWLVQHVIALPKVIQGPCLANRNVAYMWTCHKYHVMDALLVTLAIMLKHHLVTHSICWIFYYFFMATDSFIMLWLYYSSFRCLHGECRYTTDSIWVGVTLDYVAVSNQSLTQTISLFCTFSKLPWCNGAPFGSLSL